MQVFRHPPRYVTRHARPPARRLATIAAIWLACAAIAFGLGALTAAMAPSGSHGVPVVTYPVTGSQAAPAADSWPAGRGWPLIHYGHREATLSPAERHAVHLAHAAHLDHLHSLHVRHVRHIDHVRSRQ